MTQPRTFWEQRDAWPPGRREGPCGCIRGRDAELRGATPTDQVPDGFLAPIERGGASATLLITPNEARGFALCLEQAAREADAVGPPLYE